MLARLLFPSPDAPERRSLSAALLVLRLGSGAFMAAAHGWPKLQTYTEKVSSWADPIGIGSAPSLTLAVFAELLCAAAIALGLLTRAALVPLIVTMLVAVFVVHAEDPFQKKELGLLYLVSYVALLLAGPGRYSLDAWIGARIRARGRGRS
ncbi:MAG: hypothetical protein AMXMBFR64_52450 [Myxococcales bacterium]